MDCLHGSDRIYRDIPRAAMSLLQRSIAVPKRLIPARAMEMPRRAPYRTRERIGRKAALHDNRAHGSGEEPFAGQGVTAQPSGKLISLEIGRFFAAASVLFYHYTSLIQDYGGVIVLDDIFRPGHAGVPYFFVLSGFIIAFAHRRDVGRRGRIGPFLIRRAIRLYPMFLLISAVMLAGFLLVPSLGGERVLTPAGLAADLLLLPHADAILSISWSLRHEVLFYLLFCAIIAWGWRAALLIAAWGLGSFAASLLPAFEGAAVKLGSTSLLLSPLNLGFPLGLGVGWLVLSGRAIPFPRLMAGAGGALLALLWLLEWHIGKGTAHALSVLGPWGDLGYLAASALLIAGLVALEPARAWRWERLWTIVGGASYTLYLLHQPLGSVLVRLLRPLVGAAPLTAWLLASLAAIITAVAVHLTIEKWMLRTLRPLGRSRA